MTRKIAVMATSHAHHHHSHDDHENTDEAAKSFGEKVRQA